MGKIRVLHLEDDAGFGGLIASFLEAQGDFGVLRVWTRTDFETALEGGGFDLILAEYAMPALDGPTALGMTRRICPMVPFIFLAREGGEEAVLDALKKGAADWLLKSSLSRFIPTVLRALNAYQETRALREAQERIRRDQSNLRALIENTTDAIWSMDMDFRVLAFNSPASLLAMKLSGHPMEAGGNFLEHVAPAAREGWLQAAARVRKRERFLEQHGLEWDGRSYDLEVSFNPIYTEQEVTGMAVFARDVTLQKKMENEVIRGLA